MVVEDANVVVGGCSRRERTGAERRDRVASGDVVSRRVVWVLGCNRVRRRCSGSWRYLTCRRWDDVEHGAVRLASRVSGACQADEGTESRIRGGGNSNDPKTEVAVCA